jgi:hypothetical protein
MGIHPLLKFSLKREQYNKKYLRQHLLQKRLARNVVRDLGYL